MNPTAILSIFKQAERYIFSLAYPTDSVLHTPQRIHAPSTVGGITILDPMLRERLNHAINEAVEEQRFAYSQSQDADSRKRRHDGHRMVASLECLGRFLFNLLLPPVLQDELSALPDESPIILTTNDVEVPWELLHDRETFLALKHPIGRRLFQNVPARRNPKPSNNRLYLFISNPTGDLGETDEEIDALIDLFEPQGVNDPHPRVLAHTGATKWKVLEALGVGYDIIHYSGHAEPGSLLLADGQITTHEIQKTLQGQPFVFLNACWSASPPPIDASPNIEREKREPRVPPLLLGGARGGLGLTARSLAEGFIRGGAVGFLGTLWPVFDEGSREFAEWFYTRVRRGMSVGEALRQTRIQMREEQPDDPIWASFVFYGDPMLKVGSRSEQEMRHVTTLVARIEGIFGLFNRLELEQALSIHEQLITLLKQIGETHHGKVDLPLNDMLKVHFGVPNAHGDDIEQAMQAALRMIEAVRMFDWPNLALRIGISTRRVLVRYQGSATSAAYQIMGDVEGVANAIAAQAKPNQIIVDHDTKQVAHDQFIFHALEPLTIGTDLPALALYQVTEKVVYPAITALVGRESELNQLEQQWRKAKRGQGRVIGIEGEPGIGKTRLIQAFHEQLNEQFNDQVSLWIRATSHTHHQKQSYALLAQVIRQLAQLSSHDQTTQAARLAQQEKIRDLVLAFTTRLTEEQINENLALLAHVVGLPVSCPTVDNLEPAQRQRRLVRVVVELFKSQTASQPILLVLEDLQWADEASLTVLDQVMRQIRRMRLLLLAVYRTDWGWPYQEGRHRFIQTMQLDELDELAQEALLAHLLGTVASAELEEAILTRTGGNPLFLQEYVRLLQENGGLIRSGDRWEPATDLSQIPPLNKVERVIQARFDKLSPSSRQLIQKASVIGKEFEEDVLSTIQDRIAQDTHDDDIELLSTRKLIEVLGGQPFCYTFSHGLIHEIAYQLLPAGTRQTIHRLVAQAIESLYGHQADISRLAHHYYHSNDHVNAIRYALRAAKQNAEQWANQTALEWYQRAQEKLDTLKQQQATDEQNTAGVTDAQMIAWQVEALSGKGEVQATIGNKDEAIADYTCALELVAKCEVFPTTRHADLFHKIAIVYQNQGQYDASKEALEKGLEILNGLECLEAGRLHVYTGFIDFRHGKLTDGLTSCQQGLAIIEKTEGTRDLAQGYNLQGILYRHLGESEKAIIAYEQSIALYKQAQYLPGQERAYSNLGCVYQDLSQWEAALRCFQQGSALSHRTGEIGQQGSALNNLGEIYRRQGKLEQAIEAYENASQIFAEFNFEEFLGITLMNLGASYLKKGIVSKASAYLEESLALFERIEANVHLPEILRYLAELEVLQAQPASARRLAQEAVDWASRLSRGLEEGQAQRALGQAYRQLSMFEEAEACLNKSLTMLKERHNFYEIGLTLVELALLCKAQVDAGEAQSEQAIAYCDRAIAIFDELDTALDHKRAQEIRVLL